MNFLDPALNLLLFENTLNSSNAYNINSTDGILWRHDDVRLVAYKLKTQVKGEHTYKVNEISYGEETSDLKMSSDGKVSLVSKDGESKELKELQNMSKNRKMLDVLRSNGDHLKLSIQTKFLTRQLVTVSRKLKKQKIDPKKVEVVIDINSGTILITQLNQKKDIPLTVEKKDESIKVLRYSYPLFMQMFIDSRKFGAEVSIVVPNKMYSIVKFNSQLNAVLTHKKD